MPDVALRNLADEYWDALLEEYPSFATMLGDRRFDDQIEDLSEEAEARHRSKLSGIRDQLDGLDQTVFEKADRVTAGLLDEELRAAFTHIDHRLVEQQWDHMRGVHADLLLSAPLNNAPTSESAHRLAERFRQIPRLLEQAVERFRHAIGEGRTPPRVTIERSLRMIDGYLESPIDSDPWVTFPGPDGWSGESAWREELTAIASDTTRPAFARYRDALADELAPMARPDDRSGLQWIPGGPEIYAALLRLHTSLDLAPAEIHAIGMTDVTERLPAEYADVGGRFFGFTDERAIFARLRTDPSLRYTTGEEIMADAGRFLDAAKAVMGDWFGRLPKAECELRPVPAFAAADSPAAYYFQPAEDGSRPGAYFVNVDNPSEKMRSEAASIAFHESIPGHHLQIAIAMELEGLPAFQRMSPWHNAYVEGWGLYSERLAEEMGLYSTDLDRLGMLTADSLRSCRLVVDTGLHAMGWSREQAIDFFAAHAPMPQQAIANEVDRYIAVGGQATAYRIGQREIFGLRDEAKRRLGARFDIKGFHDTVLGSSLVTLPILGELLNDWIDAQLAEPS